MKKKLFTLRGREALTGYLFVLPILVLMIIWFYYPVISTLRHSFTDAHMLRMDTAEWVGFDNFGELLKDTLFLKSLGVSLILTAVVVPVQTALAMLIAVALNSLRRGKAVLRAIYYLPYITSPVAVATVFSYLFIQNGVATNFLSFFGLPNVAWHSNVEMALPFLIILVIWSYVGFFTVIYLAALQGIPVSLYEAARVDGASSVQQFFKITIPMLKPTTSLVIMSGVIYALQIFEQPFSLARGQSLGFPAGATSTMTIFFYSQAFRFYKVGYGSAAAFIIFLIVITFSLIQNKLTKGGGEL